MYKQFILIGFIVLFFGFGFFLFYKSQNPKMIDQDILKVKDISPSFLRVELEVKDINSVDNERIIQSHLMLIDGVDKVIASRVEGVVICFLDKNKISKDFIIKHIANLGFAIKKEDTLRVLDYNVRFK